VEIATPPSNALEVSETAQMAAKVWSEARPDALGVPVVSELTGRTITWSTTNAAAATVNGTGLVTGIGAGSCSIRATCEGVTAGVSVSVNASAPVVGSVTVSPTTFSGNAGATTIVAATPRDSVTALLVPGAAVTWATSNAAVATVGADSGNDSHQATVTLVGAGTCNITATSNGFDGVVAMTVTAVPSGTLRTATSADWAFLVGPQVVPGTYAGVGIANMESNLTSRVDEFVTRCTSVPGYVAGVGTIAVTNGSATVVGTGTDFTGSAGRFIRITAADAPYGYWYQKIISVQSATQCTMGFYSAASGSDTARGYLGTTDSGLSYAINNLTKDGSGNFVSDFNANYNYYDTVLGLYQAWSKVDNQSGGSAILTKARQIADHLADTANLCGFVANAPDLGFLSSTREAAMMGFACRALDARPAWFTAFDQFTDSQGDTLLRREKLGQVYGANSYFYVRDASYALMFCAMLGVLHPNSTRRAYFAGKAVEWALDPIIRKAVALPNSGGLRWMSLTAVVDGTWITAANGTTVVPATQPFINSITIQALVWVHRMLRRNGTTSGANYDAITAAILGGVRGWYKSYQQASNGFPANRRSQAYWVGNDDERLNGGTTLTTVTPPGTPFGIVPTGSTWDNITNDRQLAADSLGNIGYAHALSPGAEFLNMFHEVASSCFEFAANNSTNPIQYGSYWYSQAEGGQATQSQKNWNQHHGVGGCHRALAWITGGLETFS